MRVWTIQPVEVWERLEHDGSVVVDAFHPRYSGYRHPPYDWLAARLTWRLADYPGPATWPWWAYCRFPDLRLFRHTRDAGSREVRITLEVGEGRDALSFPCWAWDTVFRQDYLAFTEAEHADWMGRMRAAVPDEDLWPLPAPWQDELAASWERLFSPALPARAWNADSGGWSSDDREAVLGVLRRSQVRGVTHFVGAWRPVGKVNE